MSAKKAVCAGASIGLWSSLVRGQQTFSKEEPFCNIFQQIWLVRSYKILILFYFSFDFKFGRGGQTVWPKGLHSRVPGHWKVGYSAIYVTGGSQCCCTAVHSQKCAAWKNEQAI